ncbi:MAG TPA: hypothetical protein DF383_12125, partial [Deltaproteobacteria bacterium]|nr:hypothetical protein [Deltaproteobacteria bacterium]
DGFSSLFSPGSLNLKTLTSLIDSLDLESRNLDLTLGHTEYLSKGLGKTGIFALLGGRIHNRHELGIPLESALKIFGNKTDGFEGKLGLEFEDIVARLPLLGEVKLSGELQAQAKVQKGLSLVPDSSGLRIDKLEIKKEGVRISDASIEISNAVPLPYDPKKVTALKLRADFPVIAGSDFISMEVEGEMVLSKQSPDQLLTGELQIKAKRRNGNQETWSLKLKSSQHGEQSDVKIAVNSSEFNTHGKIVRRPVQNLNIELSQSVEGGKTRYGIHAKAQALALGDIQLAAPKFDFILDKEILPIFQDKIVRYSVPRFRFTANGTPVSLAERSLFPRRGLLRGPIRLVSQRPWTLEINEQTRTAKMSRLDLDFLAQGITLPKPLTFNGGTVSGVDLSGKLQGYWRMNYDTGVGQGKISLLGSPNGDFHLLIPQPPQDPGDLPKIMTVPLLSNTEWSITRIDGIDRAGQRLIGDFKLGTEIDSAATRIFDIDIGDDMALELEINLKHLPYTKSGFSKEMQRYLHFIAAQNAKSKSGVKP